MRIFSVCALALLALGACSDSTGSAVAASVSVNPGSVTLDAVGATRVVRATVSDGNGRAMPRASVTWSSNSSAVTVASAGGDSAVVTGAGNGSAVVTARSGDVTADIQVQVTQVATGMERSGDAQTGAAGAALSEPLRVVVRDRLGAPVAGVAVSFSVTLGGGTLSTETPTTGADGAAETVWTLGTSTSASQQVWATLPGGSTVSFTATAVAAAPAEAAIAAGDNQVAGVGGSVPVAPRVRVTDAFGNRVGGVAVEFAVTSGGGSVAGGEQVTDPQGLANVGSWTLGGDPGENTLTATFPGTALAPVVFTATAGTAGSLVRLSEANQAGLVGEPADWRPSVLLLDGDGEPLAGVNVVFTVTAGAGSVVDGTVTTGVDGVATVGDWIIGEAAPNSLSASAQGISAAPVVFRAVGCEGSGPGFEITLCFTNAVTPSQRAAYVSAAARWSEVITGNLPGISTTIPGGTCGANPTFRFPIDDLVIFATIEAIDGPGGILGQAGWCYRRTGGLPVVGTMRFDAADVASLEASGGFVDVVLHEMGHVLGISAPLWNAMGFLKSPSAAGSQLDTHFDGPNAVAAFNAVGGTTYGGAKVPVENSGGAGTMNSHWRESILTNELMTGYLNAGFNPLSLITVQSLADLGYVVNPAAADPYVLGASLRDDARENVIRLHDDEYRGPRFTIDPSGRRTRIRP